MNHSDQSSTRQKSTVSSLMIPKSERVDPRTAILQLAGITNRTLALISKRILEIEVSKTTINEELALIQDSAKKWLDREITDKY